MFKRFDFYIPVDTLNRRVLTFCWWDDEVRLDEDKDQQRATKRHKWRTVEQWCRRDKRSNTIERREVPERAINAAIIHFKEKIHFVEDK